MAQPKRKTSKSRSRSRKAGHKITERAAQDCETCGAPRMPHRVCSSCGTYNGRQVTTVAGD